MVGPIRGRVLVDTNKCVHCGKCVELCPTQALSLVEGVPKQVGICMACFGCKVVCPSGAITVEIEEQSYIVVEVEIQSKKEVSRLDKFFRSASHHHAETR